MSIDVIFQFDAWPQDALDWAEQAEAALFETLGRENPFEVVCLLTNDEEIQKLNASFRAKDQATNVLSWPSIEYQRDEAGVPFSDEMVEDSLGDLAFAYQTCVKEAADIGLEFHFKHLVVHGILHLLGYDHVEDNHAEKMEALEIDALARLNIPNPYEVAEL